MHLFDELDHRLSANLRASYERRLGEPIDGLPRGTTVVLAGHRAAGKSRLLPHVAALLNRPAIDLDDVLARQRPLPDWVAHDVLSFRAAERAAFRQVPRGCVVSVGGGFLASHAPALAGCVVVLVPITYDTYVERLRQDATRPRLRPELSIQAELREVFAEREELHRAARPVAFVDFALRLQRGVRARRVVTAPPGADVVGFAWHARHLGADLLELRTDVTPSTLELRAVIRALPVLAAERGAPVPGAWAQAAEMIDSELGSQRFEPGLSQLVSFHSPQALTTEAALAAWAAVPDGSRIKHVEPLVSLSRASILLATQTALIDRFGPERVTVLATGPLALPVRACLAQRNALDYLSLDPAWSAAPGQRLLADAVREAKYAVPGHGRLAILGSAIAHSRSPRLHVQPFDRIELPEDTDVGELLQTLHSTHRGFAITNPFKKRVAEAVGASDAAVNTLVRTPTGWAASNTDVAGAHAVLKTLQCNTIHVLGDGGAATALRTAAQQLGVTLLVQTHDSAFETPLTGAAVWTWPAMVEPPPALRMASCQVAVIAYGPPGRQIAQRIRLAGGMPRMLGPRWFIAQARRQRALWENAQK